MFNVGDRIHDPINWRYGRVLKSDDYFTSHQTKTGEKFFVGTSVAKKAPQFRLWPRRK